MGDHSDDLIFSDLGRCYDMEPCHREDCTGIDGEWGCPNPTCNYHIIGGEEDGY